MDECKVYVKSDEHGTLRIGRQAVMLDGVVAAFWEGHSPETIQQEYPGLSLEEVYGAITYYLAHRATVDEYIHGQQQRWSNLREQIEARPSPVIERLRALRQTGVRETV